VVDDSAALPRHRFTTGAMDDPSPETGVLEAAARVIEVLPDIRSLSCVWRTTPAGSPAGPVPQRLVLVETGPDGFAPSTAYRVEYALRRAGIRAAVEVVQAGAELADYHGDALAVARRLSLRAARSHDTHDSSDSSLFNDPPSPRSVATTRRRSAAGAHAEKRPTVDHSAARWQPRIAAPEEPSSADAEAEPAGSYEPAVPEPVAEQVPFEDGVRPIHPEPAPMPMPAEPVAAVEPMPMPEPIPEPIAPPDPAPAMSAGPTAPMADADPAAEADLSNRERELLRQLHEELAKREAEPEPGGWQKDMSAQRQPNPPGTEFNPANFAAPEFNPNEFGGPAWRQTSQMMDQTAADQTAVNGIPPYGSSAG
jgi:hypothetical protein